MIPHHDHTGIFGAIYAVAGYFVGIEAGYIQEPHHYITTIIAAGLSALTGWAVNKLANLLLPIVKGWIKKRIGKLKFKKK